MAIALAIPFTAPFEPEYKAPAGAEMKTPETDDMKTIDAPLLIFFFFRIFQLLII